MTDRDTVKSLTHAFKDQTILVIGDLMLDRYVSGSVSRISPEAPVPVVLVDREEARLGGAANVALNIQALGGNSVLAGIVGRDRAGEELLALIQGAGIGVAGIVQAPDYTTPVKTRVLAERQQVVRVDREDRAAVTPRLLAQLGEQMSGSLDRVKAVIIEDYGKGTVEQSVVDRIGEACARTGALLGLDPKDNHELAFPRLSLATPNYMEACEAAGRRMQPLADDAAVANELGLVGERLLAKWHCDLLIVTLGAHGIYLISTEGDGQVIPTRAREVFDVSGAGDTFMAAAMLALAAGADRRTAALIANVAAGVVVGKVGTATCAADELLANWVE